MTSIYIILLFVLIELVNLAESAKIKELQMMTEHLPDECYQTAETGDEVHVHYTGMLQTGHVFDSSKQENRGPLPFVLGKGSVISGWEKGVLGMCVGEKRRLTIPPHLAYGEGGHPPNIPPQATLIFETELVHLNKVPFMDKLFPLIKFLSVPFAIVYLIYYMYHRYGEEMSKEKGSKRARNGKKKK